MYLKVRIKNPSLIDFRIANPEERDAYPIPWINMWGRK
jgi:hypothetical protein